MSGFTTSPGIGLVNVDGSIDVYVKNVGGNLSLYKDAAANQSWGTDPELDVPHAKVYAVYFRFTLNTDMGTTFPASPLDWGTPGQPSTITCEKMLANHTAFSIKVDNSVTHVQDNSHDFDIKVVSATGTSRARTSEIDPTIVEKGEELEP